MCEATNDKCGCVFARASLATCVLKCSNGKGCHRRLPTSFTPHLQEEDINVRKWKKKGGRLLPGNCHEPLEMSICDMEGDHPGSNALMAAVDLPYVTYSSQEGL